MDINDFYTRVLKSLDVAIEDGYLMISNGDKLINYKYNGVPMVLPTKEHISSMLEDVDGKIINVKHLFNPLDETIIKGDSPSLTKLKKLVNVRLANGIAICGRLLLVTAENKNHQTKTPMLVNQFLTRLIEANNPGIKKIVDESTIDKWTKLYDKSFETNATKFLKVFVKKGGKVGTVKYNRLTTFKFPIYEELCNLEKSGKINGVTLRNKDIKVFKIIFEYLIEGITSNGIFTVGSNDNESPGFISLMEAYLTIMYKIQEVVKGVKGVDPEWEDSVRLELAVTIEELKSLDKYKSALAGIPREGDIVKSKLTNTNTVKDVVNKTNTMLNKEDTVTRSPTGYPQTQQPVQQQHPQQETESTRDVIRKALYGNVTGINTPVISTQPIQQVPQPMVQQPMMQQQPVMQQQAPQPMMQQPMVQQPVMQQQPMMGQHVAQPMVQQQVPQFETKAFGGGVVMGNQPNMGGTIFNR